MFNSRLVFLHYISAKLLRADVFLFNPKLLILFYCSLKDFFPGLGASLVISLVFTHSSNYSSKRFASEISALLILNVVLIISFYSSFCYFFSCLVNFLITCSFCSFFLLFLQSFILFSLFLFFPWVRKKGQSNFV